MTNATADPRSIHKALLHAVSTMVQDLEQAKADEGVAADDASEWQSYLNAILDAEDEREMAIALFSHARGSTEILRRALQQEPPEALVDICEGTASLLRLAGVLTHDMDTGGIAEPELTEEFEPSSQHALYNLAGALVAGLMFAVQAQEMMFNDTPERITVEYAP